MVKCTRSIYLRFFPEIILALFIALVVIGILRHNMWRDEMQAWMIVLASNSLSQLLFNLRYESHPPLWYFLLFFVKRISSDPVTMQWLHITIASITAWLVLKFSPFNKIQKIFLVFSYFLFYEYALVSRSYALGVLFIILFCVFVSRPCRDYLLLTLFLSLLCQTSIMGLILAAALESFLVFEYFESPLLNRVNPSKALLALSLFIAAVLISWHSMVPLKDSGWIKSLIVYKGPYQFFNNMTYAYFPSFVERLNNQSPNMAIRLFSIAVFISSLFFFIRKSSVLFLYIVGCAGIVIFFSLVYFFYPRHMGHLFILLIACWWIFPEIPSWANKSLTVILFFQFILGLHAYMNNYTHIFSDGKQAAKYIHDHKLDDLPMVADSMGTATVAGYLGKPVYYARDQRWGTFILYNNKEEPSHIEVLETAGRLSQQLRKNVLLILTYPLNKFTLNDPSFLTQVQGVATFNKGDIALEVIYLYLYKYHHL